MNCPRCGKPIAEGKTCCSNTAFGAVPGFALLARLAAVLLVLLAAVYTYFFARR